MKISFEKDQEFDSSFLSGLLQKEKNHLKVADELSKWFTKKYGSEFSGFVKVEVNLVDNSFDIHFGKEKTLRVEKDDLETIPEVVRLQREQKAGITEKTATFRKSKYVKAQDILDGKI